MAYSAVDWLPWLKPVADPRTVYTVHQYAPMAYTHQELPLVNTYPGRFDADWDGIPDRVDRTWLEKLLGELNDFMSTYHVPVAVPEYGVMRWEPNADQFMDDEMGLFERMGVNYALWLWECSWPPYAREVDAFNFRHGPDPDSHVEVPTSPLIEVIRRYWSRNTVRPSTVATSD